MARRAGEGDARGANVRHTCNPLTLTLSPGGEGNVPCPHPLYTFAYNGLLTAPIQRSIRMDTASGESPFRNEPKEPCPCV
ncbi:hypothetical protein TSH58p_18840 (plasmid) [Azospirillum sp. TSH58]|nr:hypothetical protein TSH58p_18840 [Azospirillum sp. TSH58]